MTTVHQQGAGRAPVPFPDGEPLLSIDGIGVVYQPSIIALRDVSLTVRPGEIVALLGANGAGKSTTLKAVSNLLSAERGRVTAGGIRYQGEDVSRIRPADLVRRGLVQVLEGRHCFRSLTVEDNLVTGGLGRGSGRRAVAEDLARVYSIFPRLKEKRKALSGLTSGGEQQMTAIGRALMSRPRLLVLDEPSVGLAPLIVQDIFQTLRSLNESENLSILVAEQNSAVALNYAHRAVVIETGTSVLEGSAADLRKRDDIKAYYLGGPAVAV